MKYEYDMLVIKVHERLMVLNQYGSRGWRVVHYDQPDDTHLCFVLLERPYPETPTGPS